MWTLAFVLSFSVFVNFEVPNNENVEAAGTEVVLTASGGGSRSVSILTCGGVGLLLLRARSLKNLHIQSHGIAHRAGKIMVRCDEHSKGPTPPHPPLRF